MVAQESEKNLLFKYHALHIHWARWYVGKCSDAEKNETMKTICAMCERDTPDMGVVNAARPEVIRAIGRLSLVCIAEILGAGQHKG